MIAGLSRRLGVLVVLLVVCIGLAGPAWAQTTSTAPATTTAPALPPDPMAILKAIPGDAASFLVVRNLKELDSDLASLAGMFGFPLGPNGFFPAPMELLKEKLGATSGLDENGSLAFVLTNCADVKAVEELSSRLAIYLPTNDAQAMLDSLEAKKDKDLYTVKFMGEASIAAPAGRFLVVCQSSDALRAALKTTEGDVRKAMSPDRVQAYAGQDLFLWVNLSGFTPSLRTAMQQAVAGTLGRAMGSYGLPGGESLETGLPGTGRLGEQGKEISLGVALDRRGLGINFWFRADPASALGAKMKAAKAAAGPILLGLPDEPTVLALGVVIGQGEKPQLPGVLDSSLSSQGIAEHFTPEQLAALKDGLTKMVGQVELCSVSVAGTPPEAKLGLANLVCVAQVADSDEHLQQCRKVFEAIKKVVDKASKTGENQQPQTRPAELVQWKVKAEEVAGVPVDHLVIDTSALAGGTAEEADQWKGMFGPEGIVFRIAPADKRHVVFTFGGGKDRLAKVIESARKGESPLGKGSLQALSKRLPAAPRLMEGYLHVDQALKLLLAFESQAGMPGTMPLQMRNPAPIAFCVNRVDDSAQEVNVLLPTELFLSLKEAVSSIMQMFMGGMGGTGGQGGMNMEMPPPTPPGSGVK